jgi:hypothetical protein
MNELKITVGGQDVTSSVEGWNNGPNGERTITFTATMDMFPFQWRDAAGLVYVLTGNSDEPTDKTE